MNPFGMFLALALLGAALIVAGVALLAGLAWAMIAAGVAVITLAVLVVRGATKRG
jgi:hypothetical protein